MLTSIARASLTTRRLLQAGPWSEYLDVLSGPGVPEAPRNFLVECQSANSALLSWEEGVNNGAAITEYRLEWSRKESDSFMLLYCGTNSTHEAKGLTPVTHYFFRVQVTERIRTVRGCCNSFASRALGSELRWSWPIQYAGVVCYASSGASGCRLHQSSRQVDDDDDYLEGAIEQRIADHGLLHRHWRERTDLCQRRTERIHDRRGPTGYHLQVRYRRMRTLDRSERVFVRLEFVYEHSIR